MGATRCHHLEDRSPACWCYQVRVRVAPPTSNTPDPPTLVRSNGSIRRCSPPTPAGASSSKRRSPMRVSDGPAFGAGSTADGAEPTHALACPAQAHTRGLTSMEKAHRGCRTGAEREDDFGRGQAASRASPRGAILAAGARRPRRAGHVPGRTPDRPNYENARAPRAGPASPPDRAERRPVRRRCDGPHRQGDDQRGVPAGDHDPAESPSSAEEGQRGVPADDTSGPKRRLRRRKDNQASLPATRR